MGCPAPARTWPLLVPLFCWGTWSQPNGSILSDNMCRLMGWLILILDYIEHGAFTSQHYYYFIGTPMAYHTFTEGNTNLEETCKWCEHQNKSTPTTQNNLVYSLKKNSKPPALACFQLDISAIIWVTSYCGVLSCSLRSKTRAFRCFQRDQAIRITRVSNPRFSARIKLPLSTNHQELKVSYIV